MKVSCVGLVHIVIQRPMIAGDRRHLIVLIENLLILRMKCLTERGNERTSIFVVNFSLPFALVALEWHTHTQPTLNFNASWSFNDCRIADSLLVDPIRNGRRLTSGLPIFWIDLSLESKRSITLSISVWLRSDAWSHPSFAFENSFTRAVAMASANRQKFVKLPC